MQASPEQNPKAFTLAAEGEQPESVDLADFYVSNDIDADTANRIGRMNVGDAMNFGGGAAPLFVLRRVA